MNKCCICRRILESTMNCRDCENFIPPSGPEYYGWGECKIIGRSVHSEGACVAFKDKEDTNDDFASKCEKKDTQITPVKIEIVKKKTEVDETKYYFMVYVYDNKGELIEAKWFNAENLAGRYAFEMEQYYKFLKED